MSEHEGTPDEGSPDKKQDREVFKDSGIEIIREGNNIFMNNTMTEEEHAAYIQQLKENRPRLALELSEMVQKATKTINSYNKIFIMGGIAGIVIHNQITDSDDKKIGEIVMEYCQSIAMASSNNSDKQPKAIDVEQLFELLKDIRQYTHLYYSLEDLDEKHLPIEYEMRKAMISERLFIRGDGYHRHILELFHEMFIPFKDFFIENFGFTPDDIIETFDQLESSFTLRMASPSGEPHPFLHFQLMNLSQNPGDKTEKLKEFAAANPGLIMKDNNPFIIPLNWIPYHDLLYRIRHHSEIQEKVTDALSMNFGDNAVFAEFDPHQMTNETRIYKRPVVKDKDDNYYLFSMNMGARNYFQIAQDLIKTKSNSFYNEFYQGNKHPECKDNFVEKKVRKLFEQMLPDVKFYANLNYTLNDKNLDLKCAKAENGVYELDLLGISEHATYIIEIKAGLIDEESKRGAIKSLKTNLRKTIGDAVCQSYRAFCFVKATNRPIFYQKNKASILPKNIETVFRITVSFSYWGNLASSLLKLQELGVIDSNAEFAWTVSILDLMAFSELIDSEAEFIDYLSKRIPAYQDKRLKRADELDLLGLYYENGFTIDPAFDDVDHVTLNGYKNNIDDYFERNGPKPKKKRPK